MQAGKFKNVMKRVVIDTNVIVSSTLSEKGKPAEIMDLCYSGGILVFYTAEILDEYKRVLSYERLNIAVETQIGVIEAIEEIGIMIEPIASTIPLPDETDRVFYDTARSSESTLITGNTKHYPVENFIMTPAEFLNKMVTTSDDYFTGENLVRLKQSIEQAERGEVITFTMDELIAMEDGEVPQRALDFLAKYKNDENNDDK
jgi:putative PIN family toxin of toxin-antitoxin system